MRYVFLTLLLTMPLAAHSQTDSLTTSPPPATANSNSFRPLPLYRPGFALLLSAGSAGGGLAVGHSINHRLAARLGFNLFSYTNTLTSGKDSDDIQIGFDYKVKLQNANLLIDYYPVNRAGFRLTGGAFYNLNQLTFFGKPTKAVKFNDVAFTADEVGTLTGKASFNKLAPYIGLGWGNPYTRHRLRAMSDIDFFYFT